MIRVILIGSELDRARLRARLNGFMSVVAEFPDQVTARASGLDADAFVVAPDIVTPSVPESHVASAPDSVASAFRRKDDDFRRKDGEEDLVEALTAREVEVLELLAEGMSNKAIADRLRISDQTVKFHVASISGKLGAHNRTDAVRRAVRRGLIAL